VAANLTAECINNRTAVHTAGVANCGGKYSLYPTDRALRQFASVDCGIRQRGTGTVAAFNGAYRAAFSVISFGNYAERLRPRIDIPGDVRRRADRCAAATAGSCQRTDDHEPVYGRRDDAGGNLSVAQRPAKHGGLGGGFPSDVRRRIAGNVGCPMFSGALIPVSRACIWYTLVIHLSFIALRVGVYQVSTMSISGKGSKQIALRIEASFKEGIRKALKQDSDASVSAWIKRVIRNELQSRGSEPKG